VKTLARISKVLFGKASGLLGYDASSLDNWFPTFHSSECGGTVG